MRYNRYDNYAKSPNTANTPYNNFKKYFDVAIEEELRKGRLISGKAERTYSQEKSEKVGIETEKEQKEADIYVTVNGQPVIANLDNTYYIQTATAATTEESEAKMTTTTDYYKDVSVTDIKLNEIKNRISGIQDAVEAMGIKLRPVLSQLQSETYTEDTIPAPDTTGYPLGITLDNIYEELTNIEDNLDNMLDRLCI